MSKIQVNGVIRDMTAEEQTLRDESEVKSAEEKEKLK